MHLRFHELARAELEWAAAYSEADLPGRGHRLLQNFQEVLDWILAFPHSGSLYSLPESQLEVRLFMLDRFPYDVVCAVLPEEVVVVALAHHSRTPGYWRDRLDSNT